MSNFTRHWQWAKQSLRFMGSLSILSTLTLVKRRDLFKRILSDTNRSFSEAWGSCLPTKTPQELTTVYQPINLVLDQQRVSLGLNELIPLLELLQLSGATKVLEIGTSSGGTTWHLAANIVSTGTITTVDLPPETTVEEYSPTNLATERPTSTQLGRHFRGASEETRIKQILIDSKHLVETIKGEKFDLIFIDAAHTYEHVKKDTETALKLVKTDGYLVWHDYFVFHPDYGVRRYLEELARTMPIYRFPNSLSAVAQVSSQKL